MNYRLSYRVSDQKISSAKSVKEFRRRSLRSGAYLGGADEFQRISLRQCSSLMRADFGAIAEAYVDTVTGCSGNVESAVREYCDEVLPEDAFVARKILLALAPQIKPAMKMARIGLGTRILLSLVLTYTDITFDFLVLKEYGEGGEKMKKFFLVSCSILVVPTLVNVVLAWITTRKGKPSDMIRAVVAALLQLNYIFHGLNVWRGVGKREEDLAGPLELFLVGRVLEVVCEIIPETILQLIVIFHTEGIVSNTMKFSILSSVASAAFILTDSSMMMEKLCMSSQNRGPYSHPNHGFVPSDGEIIIHVGMFLFYVGFLACAMMAISCFLTACHWEYMPLVMFFEFAVFLVTKACRKELVLVNEPAGGWLVSFLLHLVSYAMMSVAPWTHLRADFGCLGGRCYASMIVYKLLSYAAIVMLATNRFSASEDVRIDGGTVKFIFLIAMGVTLVGGVLFLASVPKSHRWTFYESKETGPEHHKWEFRASQLLNDADTKDQQRLLVFLSVHVNYLDKDDVAKWLLELTSDGDILGRGDKKLPKGCGSFSRHSLESFFEKSLQKLPYFGDERCMTPVVDHLKALRAEVNNRELSSFSSLSDVILTPSSSPARIHREFVDGPASEINKLRDVIAEHEKTIAMIMLENKELIQEKDGLKLALEEKRSSSTSRERDS
mmetsp:Transcript_16944/g.34881  ORF Transcript_16944/g.34881 Transcript_16944/m.34881 type:complete len:667 (+) Transcript_16944:181-2181(+)